MSEASPGTYLIQIARQAMACEFAVYLNAGQHRGAVEVAVQTLDLVELLEDQLTVFREHSEVCALNRQAAYRPIEVEACLFALLEQSLDLHMQTSGAFDITAGPLVKLWGLNRRHGGVPTESEVHQVLRQVGSQSVALDRQRRTVVFQKPGIEINLGGIGKGYALDRCTKLLGDYGVEDFLLHGGQSSVAARGARADSRLPPRGWTVGLKHPLRPERRLAEIYLQNRALGTSGSATRSFRFQGRRYGHILDPRTGRPVDSVLSATAIAPSAAMADALSTAFFVMGAEESVEFCRTRPELAAIIVTEGSRTGTVELQSIGLRDEDWKCFVD